MRFLEVLAAVIVAVAAFVAFKLIGFVLHVAIVAGIIGLVVGFFTARAFRRAS
jgi:hypothetical protein